MNVTYLRHLVSFHCMNLIDGLEHKQIANIRNIFTILENDYFNVIGKTILLVSKIQSTESITLQERQFPLHN